MLTKRLIQIIGLICTLTFYSFAKGQTQASNPSIGGAQSCIMLQRTNFSQIQDAPIQITEAAVVRPTPALPGYCHVVGYVTPAVGIEMRLPLTGWNGKLLEVGCGGYCGNSSRSMEAACAGPLIKGYACVSTDMGHKGRGGLWAWGNLRAEADYGYRSTHVAALAGKAIVDSYYRRPPDRSYFMGCSTGGRQGLVEAQDFPWDFDGIIAGAPAINLPATFANILWASLAATDENGKPLLSEADLKLVHRAALDKCDLDDGVKDGIISNPLACKFDPTELLCKSSGQSGCLSPRKVDALQKIYKGPTTSTGQQIYTNGAAPGSELNFVGYNAGAANWAADYFRYLGFVPAPGPSWNARQFNFDTDYKRVGMAESLYQGTNPDLRRFRDAGGRLILYHGLADAGGTGISPYKTIDYYHMVARAMGGRDNTQTFLRFFVVPGMNHCTGGAGAFAIDYLSYLEDWVEHGKAPDVLIGAHVSDSYLQRAPGNSADPTKLKGPAGFQSLIFPLGPTVPVTFTRPIYQYPIVAKYKGSGDPNDARNFMPESPH